MIFLKVYASLQIPALMIAAFYTWPLVWELFMIVVCATIGATIAISITNAH